MTTRPPRSPDVRHVMNRKLLRNKVATEERCIGALRSVDRVKEQINIYPPFRSIFRWGAKSDFGGEIFRRRCQVSLPLSALP